jgi:hypothetical protein
LPIPPLLQTDAERRAVLPVEPFFSNVMRGSSGGGGKREGEKTKKKVCGQGALFGPAVRRNGPEAPKTPGNNPICPAGETDENPGLQAQKQKLLQERQHARTRASATSNAPTRMIETLPLGQPDLVAVRVSGTLSGR